LGNTVGGAVSLTHTELSNFCWKQSVRVSNPVHSGDIHFHFWRTTIYWAIYWIANLRVTANRNYTQLTLHAFTCHSPPEYLSTLWRSSSKNLHKILQWAKLSKQMFLSPSKTTLWQRTVNAGHAALVTYCCLSLMLNLRTLTVMNYDF